MRLLRLWFEQLMVRLVRRLGMLSDDQEQELDLIEHPAGKSDP